MTTANFPSWGLTKPPEDITDLTDEKPPEAIKIRIGPDVFECIPELPMHLVEMVVTSGEADAEIIRLQNMDADELSKLTGDELKVIAGLGKRRINDTLTFLDEVMYEASAKRFAERMRSKTEPITHKKVFQVYQILMEKYGLRPTTPSSPSSPGHDGAGTSSTVGAPAAV